MLQEENNIEEQLIENQTQINNFNDNSIRKKSIFKIILNILKNIKLILILTIFDIYFGSLYSSKCSYTKKIIININLYNNIQISINTLWIIFVTLIIANNKNNKFEFSNENAFIIIILLYYLFSIIWNIIGTCLISDLLDNDLCNRTIINYLFFRIIINYFYNIYKFLNLMIKCKI